MKRWIVLLMLALLWGYALVQAGALGSFNGQVFMYYGEGEGVEQDVLQNAVEREKEHAKAPAPGITAWSAGIAVEVKNRELGRKKDAECIAVYGSKEIASMRRLDHGNYGCRTDKDGCIISRGLALELFSSTDVAGRSVWCGDKAYVIRGVTDDRNCVILIPAKKDDRMRHILFESSEGNSGRVGMERFLYKYGIARGKTLVDGSLFFSVSGLCAVMALWLVPAVLCIFVRGKKGRERALLLGVAAAIFLAGLFLIRMMRIQIPADWIPGRWSDFDFWTRKFRELHSDMERVGEAGRVRWVVLLKTRLLQCAGCSAIWSAGFLTWCAKEKKQFMFCGICLKSMV